jgi:hypothetical protein
LDNEGLEIVWVVQGEKRMITGDMRGNQIGQMQTRAVFHLDEDGEFVGDTESGYYSFD